ncbi:hypothetical protein RIF29_41709 [Crotalaria pallida]|uniref:DUF7036 domain-containing protein n=1 Tax=Crotalaria pallida TaxID=3830 RepID=A0AAN9HRS6_CROPI
MGKLEQQSHQEGGDASPSSGIVCHGCCSMLLRTFTFKCIFILFIGLSALFSSLFWILPKHTTPSTISFDAKDEIKQSATVQASFKLEKPVSQLIPYVERLEYDINDEIGLPRTKVAILSMHQSVAPNWTDVVFGVLSDPMNVSINPVSLSVMRSSLIELYLQQSNLTLTTSIFGNASIFEILKIPGGLTINPVQSTSIFQMPQALFNFTLNNSISEVLDNFAAFKDELKLGLHLKYDENLYVLLTNENGSTLAPQVTVEASILPGFGGLIPPRLKQLAQTIQRSSAKNLGLDNSVFGKVKGIRLSSLLNDTLHDNSPSPSPAPSPQIIDLPKPSVSPYHSPSYSSIPPAIAKQPPCFDCEVSSPAPSIATAHPPDPCPFSGFIYHSSPSPESYSPPAAAAPTSHTTKEAQDPSPVADLSHVFKLRQDEERSKKLVSQLLAPSSSSSAGGDFRYREILLMGFCMLLTSFVFLNYVTF